MFTASGYGPGGLTLSPWFCLPLQSPMVVLTSPCWFTKNRPPFRVPVSANWRHASPQLYGVIGAYDGQWQPSQSEQRVQGNLLMWLCWICIRCVMEKFDFQNTACFRFLSVNVTGASMPGIVALWLLYEAKNERLILVIAANSDSIFKRFMNAMNRLNLAKRSELAQNAWVELKRSGELEWCYSALDINLFSQRRAIAILERSRGSF